tara:strand:+ start:206 stop:907 length:702 start_codon:yes stop_codon:yes gene_type:complete
MVNIDTVHQRVLALANKEQRGYITPQEFNLFANQAQMDIFEQYFYDINQFGRLPGNSTGGSDMLDYLEEKIDYFKEERNININNTNEFYNIGGAISDLYKIDSVIYNSTYTCEQVNSNQVRNMISSRLYAPTSYNPIYEIKRSNRLFLYPSGLQEAITVNYIRKPKTAQWSGLPVSGANLYNSNESIDFELHPSEETKLVFKILQLAGVSMKDNNLYQIGSAEDNKNIQQEKQ